MYRPNPSLGGVVYLSIVFIVELASGRQAGPFSFQEGLQHIFVPLFVQSVCGIKLVLTQMQKYFFQYQSRSSDNFALVFQSRINLLFGVNTVL